MEQNYIGKNDGTHAITFTPPAPEKVPELMDTRVYECYFHGGE